MSVTDIYPYENIIGGMPLTHKYGPSFIEFTKALSQQLDSFITGTERVQADLSPDNALGPVLDSIGKLFDVTRRAGQSDSTLSDIILNEVSTREQSTIDAITDAINNVIGVEPIIEEYPDIDFVNDHGLSRNEGAFLVTIVMPDPEQLIDLKRQTDLYKAAGIAAIYNILSELTFTEEITIIEELFSIMLTIQDEESMTTLVDHLDFEIGLTEALTSITDALRHEGEMFLSEDLTILYDELSLEGLLYFSEDMTTLDDYFGGGAIESFHTEALTTISEDLGIEKMVAFIEALTAINDYLSHEAEMYFSEDLTTLSDVFGGGAIDAISFIESLPSRVPRIGSAKIGVDVIGGGWKYGDLGAWDYGEWDVAEWDSTDGYLKITELF